MNRKDKRRRHSRRRLHRSSIQIKYRSAVLRCKTNDSSGSPNRTPARILEARKSDPLAHMRNKLYCSSFNTLPCMCGTAAEAVQGATFPARLQSAKLVFSNKILPKDIPIFAERLRIKINRLLQCGKIFSMIIFVEKHLYKHVVIRMMIVQFSLTPMIKGCQQRHKSGKA